MPEFSPLASVYTPGALTEIGASISNADGAANVKYFLSTKPHDTKRDHPISNTPSSAVTHPPRYGKDGFGYRLAAFIAAVIPRLQTLTPMYNELADACLLMVDYHSTTAAFRSKGLGTVAGLIKESPERFIKGLDSPKLPPLVTRLLYIIGEGLNQLAMSGKHHSEQDSAVAKDSLLRLVLCPEGATLIPLVADRMCAMIKSKDVSQRYRGLTALKALCGNAPVAVLTGVDEFRRVLACKSFDSVFRFLHEPEMKIRRMAIMVLEQTVPALSEEYVLYSHKTFIPQLLAILTPSSQDELLSIATKTLVRYFSSCPEDAAVSYMRPLYLKLDALVKDTLRDQIYGEYTRAVVKAISAMADRLQGSFRGYYDIFMPTLKELITLLGESERPYLRWYAIDCVAHIGLAVGNRKFRIDSPTIMTAVLTALSDRAYRSYYTLGQVIAVAHTLSRAIENECEDFMRQVLPSAFQILSRGDTKLVEFHVGACALLQWYASHPHGIFKPYVYDATHRVLPLLSDPEPVVRASAAECLSRLLPCAASSGVACSTSLRLGTHAALTSAIEKETELPAIVSEVCAMEQVLGLVRLPYAPESCIERTTSALCKGFEFYFRWHTTIIHSCLPLGTYEQGPQKENQPEPALDGGLLKRMAGIICTLVRSLEERCLPSFDKLAPLVSKLLAEPRPWMEHLHGLAIIGDILKIGPAACTRYSTYYLPGIVERLDSRVDSVRAAAARAVATLAERGGSAFAAECGRALPSLARAIQLPKPLFTEHSLSTELSIVALSRIMQNHWDTPEVKGRVNDLFPNLLHSLQSLGTDTLGPPLELICSAVERNDGVAMEHAAHVFHVLQNTLARDEVAKDTTLSKRVRACLQRLTLDPLPDESVRKALGVIYELFSTSEAEDDKT